MMFNTLKAVHKGENIKLCTSKHIRRWRYVDIAEKDVIQTDSIEDAESISLGLLSKCFCEPLQTHDTKEMHCAFLQVQTVSCSRTIPASRCEYTHESEYVRSQYIGYIKRCAICDACINEKARIKREHDNATRKVILWNYQKLIDSHINDDGSEGFNENSWYVMSEGYRDHIQHRHITEQQAIEEYSHERGNFTHADFVNANLYFWSRYRIMSHTLIQSEKEGVYNPNYIHHVYNRYVDDYRYLLSIAYIEGANSCGDEILLRPSMPYATAFEKAATFLYSFQDRLRLGDTGVGPFVLDDIITGIRNYFGNVTVYSARFVTKDGRFCAASKQVRKRILQQLHAVADQNQVFCAYIHNQQVTFDMMCEDAYMFRLLSIVDYENVGHAFMASLFVKYVWVADIADLWTSAEDVCTLDDQYKKYIKNARRIANDATTEWCARLLDNEGIVIRPSETGQKIDGTICSDCLNLSYLYSSDCYLTCTIVYFSERNMCVLKRYLERLRDICANMSVIGAHVQDTFSRQPLHIYNSSIEDSIIPAEHRDLLATEAEEILRDILSDHAHTNNGFSSRTAYMDMVNSVTHKEYSFLYTHSIAFDTFYMIITTGNILCKIDRAFKRQHCNNEDMTDRYLFSMGIIVLDTDNCDNSSLYELHTLSSVLLDEGSQSVVDSISEQIVQTPASKKECPRLYFASACIYIRDLKAAVINRKRLQHIKFVDIRMLCAKFHCKYSPVYFDARFNDGDPIRLYDQSKSLNIRYVSDRPDYQYVYHKAHMFRVYVFGAFTDKLKDIARIYTQKVRAQTRATQCRECIFNIDQEDYVNLSQCCNCACNTINVEQDSIMGTYINAHIAKLMPTIMSFYKFRSFSNTTPAEINKRIYDQDNMFCVKACNNTVEFLYHEDSTKIANIASQIMGARINKQTTEEILNDPKFYMIIMEAHDTVYGTASTSVESMCEDIDICYYDSPPVRHNDRDITISRACHDSKATKVFCDKYAYDFVQCRDTAVFESVEKRRVSVTNVLQQKCEQHKQQDSQQNIEQSVCHAVYERALEKCDECYSEDEEKCDERYSEDEEEKEGKHIENADENADHNTEVYEDTHAISGSQETKHTIKTNAQPYVIKYAKTNKLSLNTNTSYKCSVFDRSSGAKRFMKTHHSLISAGKLIGSRRKIDKPLRARRSLSRESRAAREGGYESDGYESCSEKSSVYRARSVSKNRRRVKEEKSSGIKQEEKFDLDKAIQAELNRRALYEEQQKRKETEKENARLQKSDSKTLQKYKKEQKKHKQKNKRR